MDAERKALTAGMIAFLFGNPRIVPTEILVGSDPEVGKGDGATNARAWYRGWDTANLAAPVPD